MTVRLTALLATVALFAVVMAQRRHFGFSNVDDYLYAGQTRALADAFPRPGAIVDAWRAFGSSTPLVPILALPLAAISDDPDTLVLVQLLPLLVLVLSARSLLGSLGAGRGDAWLGAVSAGALAPVLSYAAMYHYGVAAAACTVAAYAAFARSDGLRDTRWAVATGIALGLLAITRVIGPLYVLAVALPLLATRPAPRGAAVAAGTATLLAAPWWIACGSRAWDYLTSAGYGDTVFTRHASVLSRVHDRLDWTADETGWLLVVVLLAGTAFTLRMRRGPLAAALVATTALGLALLATSTNLGTAFALPFVVLVACLVPPRALAAVAAIGVVALLGVLPDATVAGQPLWHTAPPGIEQARAALGCEDCDPPDSDALNRAVARVIGTRPTAMLRSDALLNPNGLRFVAPVDIRTQIAGAAYAIAGPTDVPYLTPALPPAHSRIVFRRRFSADAYVVVVTPPRP